MLFRRKKQDTVTKRGWIKIGHNGRTASVQLSGNLNRAQSRELRVSLEDLIKRHADADGEIIINLSQISFIDATIAATLAQIARQAQERKARLLMVDASLPVQKLFTGLGIENLLSEAQRNP